MALTAFARFRSAVTGGVQPVVPPVPTVLPPGGHISWLTQVARTVNTMLTGKINCTVDVVLRAGETTTEVTDSRIGTWSIILPMAASASGAVAMGFIWIVPMPGKATIHHVSAPETDQHFRLAIFG